MSSKPRMGVVLSLILLAAACDDRGPTTPTATLSPVSSIETHVQGTVLDTLSRPLPGARVDVLDGQLAGRSASADDDGFYRFVGNASGVVRLRASRDGFETGTISTVWKPSTSGEMTSFFLKTLAPALAITPGSYTLTVRSDISTATGHQRASCSGFPADLLSRTYDATITISPFATADSRFLVELASPTMTKPPGATCVPVPGAAFQSVRGCFSFHVAGQSVGFEFQNGGWGWDWIEEWPGFRYLTIEGYAPTSEPATSSETSTTIPFAGTFEYCELRSQLTGHLNCYEAPADQIIEYRSCSSQRDAMIFTKR